MAAAISCVATYSARYTKCNLTVVCNDAARRATAVRRRSMSNQGAYGTSTGKIPQLAIEKSFWLKLRCALLFLWVLS